MKTYSRVYFSLCLFLAISGRSRTQWKLNPREKFPIYGIILYCVTQIVEAARSMGLYKEVGPEETESTILSENQDSS